MLGDRSGRAAARRRAARSRVWLLLTLGLFAQFPALAAGDTANGGDLAMAKSAIVNAAELGASARLLLEARDALATPLDSVVDKTRLAASGDPHDYFSFAPYWWPDPDRPDGLPYERRDGEYNPATRGDATDKQRLIDFIDTVDALAWGYRLSGDPHYADRAVAQLEHWFLDPETRMNPNLRYAQAIPGRVDGRGIGIIESRLLIDLAAAIERLTPADAMTPTTLAGLHSWYADYLDWLQRSDNGRDEADESNNHGTWYDAQVVAFARFLDRPKLAQEQLQRASQRLDAQFGPDGRQPLELERTRPWHYVNFNLEAWSILLDEAAAMDLDWPEGNARERLAAAYRWVAEHAAAPENWPYDELHAFAPEIALANLAAARRHDLLGERQALANHLIANWLAAEARPAETVMALGNG
ncbi:alginate lyase family protein [Salinicola avicenniae]|uniref:alginate lyase family protein n=1 Tax=Salinicola avicenniae TaxID=2916836 RepID=UPI0020740CE3|nr:MULTISPECIES: alginate lyase family protein [unclassified Salinicola]